MFGSFCKENVNNGLDASLFVSVQCYSKVVSTENVVRCVCLNVV